MISIVIPCFNEEIIIDDFIDELNKNISEIDEDFEVIFVDNKSNDKTVFKIKDKFKIFKNSKIICLTNYFGKEAAILSGIDNCKGESCIIIDPDLVSFSSALKNPDVFSGHTFLKDVCDFFKISSL